MASRTADSRRGRSRRALFSTGAGAKSKCFEGSRCLHDIKANSDILVRFGPLSENRNFRLSEWHATDPPHKRLRPRKAATFRGPKSHTKRRSYTHTVLTAQAPSLACATACACFATCDAGNPVFIIQLTPLLTRDGRPRREPVRSLRQTLKFAARVAGLRCLSAEQVCGGES